MFSSFSGFKSTCGDLTLVVVSEFNEWKVLAYGPGVTIHGARQFSEGKAKEHARSLAETYLKEQRHQAPAEGELPWEPTTNQDWMVWRG